MWPFDAATSSGTDRRLDARLTALETQLLDVTKRLIAVEGKLDEIDVEWSEWYDKYRRLYARIAKRDEREGKTDDQSRHDAPGSTNHGGDKGNGPRRTPRNLRGF